MRIDRALGDLGVLLEPTSVVATAWEQAERIGARARFRPKVALVTGAGPIGLLAASLARQRGLETYVVDLATDGPKPRLVAELRAHYHSEPVSEVPVEADIVIECTGPSSSARGERTTPGAVIARTGLSHQERVAELSPEAMNKALVLRNKVVFGSVTGHRRHYDPATEALAAADRDWLAQLITRRVSAQELPCALEKQPGDVKVVVDMIQAA